MYVYTTESRNSSALENDWQQHGRHAAFVITQQYSSATLFHVTALSLSLGKIRCAFLKKLLFHFFLIVEIAEV
jgi:hypothetical protein